MHMVLYARSDVVSVTVPPATDKNGSATGGCGQTHIRPVINGAPVKEWKLECFPCEQFLRADIANSGFRKQRTVNENAGMKLAERYPGLWASTTDTIPETPDEEKYREHMEAATVTRNAASQTQAMDKIGDALAAVAQQGAGNAALIEKLAELQLVLAQQQMPSPTVPILPVAVDAPEDVNTADQRKCADCDVIIVREPGQKGALPWRCPEHKAAKAAARRKAA